MTPNDAAKLLEIPADTSPEKLDAHFLELRRKLEDKIAKAPTPGLQAKYRHTLQEITEAFETLTLAADSTTLPVLQRQDTATVVSPPAAPSTPYASTPSPRVSASAPVPRRAAKRKSSPFEFIMVALIAIALLGGGGWWILRVREQKAVQARVTAAAEAAALQKKQEEIVEAGRLAQLATELRTKLAESQVAWDVYESEMRDTERRASDAKSELRSFRDGPATRKAELSAHATGQEIFTNWLKAFLLRHPAKIARARAEQLLEAKSVEAARQAVDELVAAMAPIDQAIEERRLYYLQTTAEVLLESKPAGMSYVFTDTYGRTFSGTTPGRIPGVPLTHVIDPTANSTARLKLGEFTTGANTARFSRQGWDDITDQKPSWESGSYVLQAEFAEGSLRIESQPAGIPWQATNARGLNVKGTTPATLSSAPPGRVTVRLARPGYQDVEGGVEVDADKTATISLDQRSQQVRIGVTEPDSVIFVDGKFAGRKEVTLTNLAPGEHALQLELKGYAPYRTKFTVKQEWTQLTRTFSFQELAAENIACTACNGQGQIPRSQRCPTCNGTTNAKCSYCEGRGTLGGINGFPTIRCHACNGMRYVRCEECVNGIQSWKDHCLTCNGDGRLSTLQLAQ